MAIAMAIFGVGLLAVAVALYLFVQKSDGPASQAPALAGSSPVSVINGMTVVTLNPARQQQRGIRTELLAASSHRTETTAYATVMDSQPLVDLRSRHSAAQSDVAAAAVSVVVYRVPAAIATGTPVVAYLPGSEQATPGALVLPLQLSGTRVSPGFMSNPGPGGLPAGRSGRRQKRTMAFSSRRA